LRRAAFLLAALIVATPVLGGDAFYEEIDLSTVRRLAIQDKGRKKPLDSFARQRVKLITGYECLDGEDPVATLLAMVFERDRWQKRKALRIDFHPLLKLLRKPAGTKRVSIEEIRKNPAFRNAFDRIDRTAAQRDPGKKAILELSHRLLYFGQLESDLRIVPDPSDPEATWWSIAKIEGHTPAVRAKLKSAYGDLRRAFRERDAAAFNERAARLARMLRELAPELYPGEPVLGLECTYNAWKPFRMTWVAYALGFACFLLYFAAGKRPLYWVAFVVMVSGLLIHAAGLGLRSVIGGRAPLANLYESIIVFGAALILFAIIFEAIYRARILGAVACFLGFLTMILADLTGINKGIDPLVPVLNSAWLQFHVITVMLGYGAFALDFGIGLSYLIVRSVRGGSAAAEKETEEGKARRKEVVEAKGEASKSSLAALERYNYRVLQIGFLFLTLGIVTGSIWANYAWGRYWGWDPKETWSFVTWIVYGVILHGRLVGWIRGVKSALASVIGFATVLFTWFGVSFLLPGLHSYLS
jgi:cytochrome c-type biogenesis protein CcsB